jgi:TPP-dependent pyruvate/acetoin dehydrogenase alpha subunit
MAVHTTADDPKRYRTEEEVEQWKKKDPIARFQKYLLNKGVITQDIVDGLDAEVAEEIQSAIDRAEEQMKSLGNPIDMFEHAYAEMPPHLKEQRESLARELAEQEGEHG